MAFGLGTVVIVAGGGFLAKKYFDDKKKAKAKKKKADGNGNGNGKTNGMGNGKTNGNGKEPDQPPGPVEQYITWDFPEECSGWLLHDGWVVDVARPMFVNAVEEAIEQKTTLDPVYLARLMVDPYVPEHCPVPNQDFTQLQTTIPGQPDYFENEAVLGLYYHVLEALEYGAAEYNETGEIPLIFPVGS